MLASLKPPFQNQLIAWLHAKATENETRKGEKKIKDRGKDTLHYTVNNTISLESSQNISI